MATAFVGIGVMFAIFAMVMMLYPSALNWFGRFPNNFNHIDYQDDNGAFRFHFPVFRIIMISVILIGLLMFFMR